MLKPDTKYNILHKQAQGSSVNISTLKLATHKKGFAHSQCGFISETQKNNIIHPISRIKDKNTSSPQQDIRIQQKFNTLSY